ncbi:MAG: hypothetical protein NDP13_01995 [Crenarchaeota archaeon]|nr:hypothetical protein [Thermoproteota archaeon]MCR8455458.1 hypothetical protein [Thermoproteota archaeon]
MSVRAKVPRLDKCVERIRLTIRSVQKSSLVARLILKLPDKIIQKNSDHLLRDKIIVLKCLRKVLKFSEVMIKIFSFY